MSQSGRVIEDIVILVVFVGCFGWLLLRAIRRSDDPRRLTIKWAVTLVMLVVLFRWVVPMIARSIDQENYFMVIFDVGTLAGSGLVLAIIWRHNIASLIAKPFGDLYDGGQQQIDARPFYSAAQARKNRGHYTEAIAEIRSQLERFPDDLEGHIMLAAIQAENLHDLPGAEITIQRFCNQPGHSQRSVAYALNTLADWHLKLTQDRDAARQDLEMIMERFPESEMASLAAQRIAHLASKEHLLAYHDRKRIEVKPGVEDIGLLPVDQQPKAPGADLALQAKEYVEHLAEHPLDTEAREKLATIYADHYGRLDLATDQLEQLITLPGQPGKRVVHWLNLLADLQIRNSANHETVKQTVQRIIDLFPNSGVAQTARTRLDHLKLEIKGKDKSQTIKLGSYEQDIGLKRGLPNKL